MEKHRLADLYKIKVFDIVKSRMIYYSKERKNIFGKVKKKEGFYMLGYPKPSYLGKDCPKHYIISGGFVYEKPECRLFFQNDEVVVIIRDTLKEAEDAADDIEKQYEVQFITTD